MDSKIAALNENTQKVVSKKRISIIQIQPSEERPLIGLVVIKGICPDGSGKWDGGTGYDPKTSTK
ncbi:MAG: DUF2147 domain-containing protein [Verrucomicrobia bacterium]|nr:DUF2147 domain-containing protein [Verrucomicrobiota bacterium]